MKGVKSKIKGFFITGVDFERECEEERQQLLRTEKFDIIENSRVIRGKKLFYAFIVKIDLDGYDSFARVVINPRKLKLADRQGGYPFRSIQFPHLRLDLKTGGLIDLGERHGVHLE